MKIDRLYTLSQFIDYLDTIQVALFMQWQYVKKYNEFLKQPLTKEMFVNEIEKPTYVKNQIERHMDSCNCDLCEKLFVEYEENLKAWQEAEKKVVFEGFKKENNTIENENFKTLEIIVNSSGYIMVSSIFSEPFTKGLNLSDLAEKTNGELKTKNIEI